MNRIFGLRQKQTSSTYGDFIPFGTQGKHTIIGNGLALEEQLSVGGDGAVAITEDTNGDTTITETNYQQDRTTAYKNVSTFITTTKPDATTYPIDDKLPTGIDLTGATYVIQNSERGARKIKKVIVITADDNIYQVVLEREGDE